MTNTDSGLEIRITRLFHAPPEVVFSQWLDAEALRDWFAPETYIGLSSAVDPQVGGKWRVEYQAPNGDLVCEHGVYKEIGANLRLVMTLNQGFDPTASELTITLTFEPVDEGTVMSFHQTGFARQDHRDGVAEGWIGCLDKLACRLEQPSADLAEIETLFGAWFDACERKDLDAAMAPISPNIVSYEHSAPLEVRDVQSLRAECKQGFDRSGPEFRWDIPDLRIIVRGDIAVTWGLNRMADHTDGVVRSAMWSRGTRIFQRIDGHWRMIHQHVSFPFDPNTGQARLDLTPDVAA